MEAENCIFRGVWTPQNGIVGLLCNACKVLEEKIVCLKTGSRKSSIRSAESCKLGSRKQRRQESILSYHPFRSSCVSLSSPGRLQSAAWNSFSKVETLFVSSWK